MDSKYLQKYFGHTKYFCIFASRKLAALVMLVLKPKRYGKNQSH